MLELLSGGRGDKGTGWVTLQLVGRSGSTAGEVANCMVLDVRVHRYFNGGDF